MNDEITEYELDMLYAKKMGISSIDEQENFAERVAIILCENSNVTEDEARKIVYERMQNN